MDKGYLLQGLFLCMILIFASCNSNSKNTEVGSIVIDTTEIETQPTAPSESNIIYTNKDLFEAKYASKNEFELSLKDSNGNVTKNTEDIIVLPSYMDFDIVIRAYTEAGDNIPYTLHVVDSGLTDSYGLTISPNEGEPWDGGDNLKREFEIYSDYLIHIKIEEHIEGDTTRYEKFYRINDQGEFYEVKK